MSKRLVMVDVLSQYRCRYVVEVDDNIDQALTEVEENLSNIDFQEFSQLHLGNVILSHREIDETEYLKTFDEDNDYLRSWTAEQKLKWINRKLNQ